MNRLPCPFLFSIMMRSQPTQRRLFFETLEHRQLLAVSQIDIWEQPVVLGNNLIFVASDTTRGAELWKSDGTEAGTVLVRDIRSGATGSKP